MIKRYFDTMGGVVTPPANPKLTLSVVVGGSFVSFQASLTRALDANFTINRIFADNFISCGGAAQGSIQQNIAQTVNAGTFGLTFGYQLMSGTVNTNKNRVYNVNINGSAVNNGDTITIGSFTVDVVLQQCS